MTCCSWQRAFRCRGGTDPPRLAAHACRTRLSQEKVHSLNNTTPSVNQYCSQGLSCGPDERKDAPPRPIPPLSKLRNQTKFQIRFAARPDHYRSHRAPNSGIVFPNSLPLTESRANDLPRQHRPPDSLRVPPRERTWPQERIGAKIVEIVVPSDLSLVDATVAQPKDEALILFTFHFRQTCLLAPSLGAQESFCHPGIQRAIRPSPKYLTAAVACAKCGGELAPITRSIGWCAVCRRLATHRLCFSRHAPGSDPGRPPGPTETATRALRRPGMPA